MKDYLISHRVASLQSDCLGAFEKINDCKFELEERWMFSLFFCWLGKYYLQKVCNNIVLAKQYNIKLSSTIRHRCLNILHGKPINKLIQHFFFIIALSIFQFRQNFFLSNNTFTCTWISMLYSFTCIDVVFCDPFKIQIYKCDDWFTRYIRAKIRSLCEIWFGCLEGERTDIWNANILPMHFRIMSIEGG